MDSLESILQTGVDEFATWSNSLALQRARLMGEPLAHVRVLDDGTLQGSDGQVCHDFISGYGTQAFGHRNPTITGALQNYLASQIPSFFPSGISPFAGRFARRLGERSGYSNVALASSGSEAVEAAFKLARAATGRTRILCLEGAYHGMTMGSLALMEPGPMRDRFGPHVPHVEALPFGDVAALECALWRGDVAAVIVEPVQVEGGVRVLPAEYVLKLMDAAARFQTLVIADEVQTGLLRTGHFLASSVWPRPADVVVLAKSLGGGLLPLSATLTSDAIFKRAYGTIATAELHHYTFAGNAPACVVGLAALQLMTDDLARQVRTLGDWFLGALRDALAGLPLVAEVRGNGLLVGIALAEVSHPWLDFDALGMPELSAKPSSGTILCHRLYRHGFLTQITAHDWRVVRVQPPLNVSRDVLQRFITACRQELEFLCGLM